MANKILECTQKLPTQIWMDSFQVPDHEYGLENGCVGVTTSPTWAGRMVSEEIEAFTPLILQIMQENPSWGEREIMWDIYIRMAKQRSKIMLPMYREGDPTRGLFSVQTEIYAYRDSAKMIAQVKQAAAVAENILVKIPATKAGFVALEESAYLGIPTMATMCFCLDQVIYAAEAIERGMKRREAEGKSVERVNPACAILMGLQDEYMEQYAKVNLLMPDPQAYNWAAIAVVKKAYHLLKERGYRTRIATAQWRHRLQYEQLMGADMIMAIPAKWQRRYAPSDIEIKSRIDEAIPEAMLDTLLTLEPFRMSYTEGSITPDSIETFGPWVQNAHYFLNTYEEGLMKLRNVMLKDPLA